MFDIELKSNKLKNYITTILGKEQGQELTDEDLASISSLKLNKDVIQDLSLRDLTFFENLTSLSISGVNIGNSEINMISNLKKLQTLSISNAKIDLSENKYLNMNLENLIFVNCEGLDIEKFNENKGIVNLTIVNCKDANLNGVSNLTNLKEVNLAGNEEYTNKDIEDIWNIEKLEKVNLDGDKNIDIDKKDGVEVSHESEYTPTESRDWNIGRQRVSSLNLSDITKFTPEQLQDLEGLNITVRAGDVELLKSDRGQEIINALSGKNSFNLTLNTTADLNMEDMEALNGICNFDKVHVQTGWQETQDRGYSYETYKAIKQEVLNIIKDIAPNMPEQQKYIEIRKRLTENIKYDYAALQTTPRDKDYYSSRNLENGLLNHTCVCAGYADILKNVLAEVGIECKYVEGMTDKGELHAWNQVRLKGDDGQYHWYNDDVTWDATGKEDFKYSLLDDQEFSKTHKCIPGRTEGGYVHNCNAPAPAAVRAQRHARNNQSQELGEDR